MERKPLYFDNAATSYPKPEEVYVACDTALRHGGNPGRGGHRLALDAARTMFEGREALAEYLGASGERLIFTSGCTAAVNLVLNGFVGAGRLAAGDTVLCSSYEHNAVMRPLRWLENHSAIKVCRVAPAAQHVGLVDLADLERLLVETKPRLCAFTMACNVSGEVLNLAAAADLCLRYDVPLLIDGAQGAGVLALDLSQHPGIAFFAASCHKGLLGPVGLGLLYVREGEALDPAYCGGTGSRSESLEMPLFLPDRLEPGTPAVQLVAGLTAALVYLTERDSAIGEHESKLADYFADQLAGCLPSIKVYGRAAVEQNSQSSARLNGWPKSLATFALSIPGRTADIAADILDQRYDIAVRPGLHCAVSAHETFGTVSGGLLRASFGAFNTRAEIDRLLEALGEVARDARL
ncbi:MAG: aminotransferase class V-fold PLP-dependent enzyme [Cyanobacteria bacterium REEB67]|nr:aminotransferase class V-fold PLP-dependent enzyme [Cyanobacteria bacterium REEB67]